MLCMSVCLSVYCVLLVCNILAVFPFDCESREWAICTTAPSTEADELGLTRWTSCAAHHIEIGAVAGLLCVLVRDGVSWGFCFVFS